MSHPASSLPFPAPVYPPSAFLSPRSVAYFTHHKSPVWLNPNLAFTRLAQSNIRDEDHLLSDVSSSIHHPSSATHHPSASIQHPASISRPNPVYPFTNLNITSSKDFMNVFFYPKDKESGLTHKEETITTSLLGSSDDNEDVGSRDSDDVTLRLTEELTEELTQELTELAELAEDLTEDLTDNSIRQSSPPVTVASPSSDIKRTDQYPLEEPHRQISLDASVNASVNLSQQPPLNQLNPDWTCGGDEGLGTHVGDGWGSPPPPPHPMLGDEDIVFGEQFENDRQCLLTNLISMNHDLASDVRHSSSSNHHPSSIIHHLPTLSYPIHISINVKEFMASIPLCATVYNNKCHPTSSKSSTSSTSSTPSHPRHPHLCAPSYGIPSLSLTHLNGCQSGTCVALVIGRKILNEDVPSPAYHIEISELCSLTLEADWSNRRGLEGEGVGVDDDPSTAIASFLYHHSLEIPTIGDHVDDDLDDVDDDVDDESDYRVIGWCRLTLGQGISITPSTLCGLNLALQRRSQGEGFIPTRSHSLHHSHHSHQPPSCHLSIHDNSWPSLFLSVDILRSSIDMPSLECYHLSHNTEGILSATPLNFYCQMDTSSNSLI